MKLPRRPSAALLGLAALWLAGCGSAGSGPGGPPPLASHLRVIENVALCDRGTHHFCGRELVVVGAGHLSGPTGGAAGSAAAEKVAAAPLMAAERAALAHAGWSPSGGQVAGDASASSPGGRRYLSYGPATIDLQAIADGNLSRAPVIVAALRREVARRADALSMLVQAGTG